MQASFLRGIEVSLTLMIESAFTDQERLRRLIRAELEKHRPRENALAALEVVAETRMRMVIEPELNPEAPQGGNGSWRPDAVRRAVEELRRTHPLLFARPTEERLGVADEGSAVARKIRKTKPLRHCQSRSRKDSE